jgi:hypothetical protein
MILEVEICILGNNNIKKHDKLTNLDLLLFHFKSHTCGYKGKRVNQYYDSNKRKL